MFTCNDSHRVKKQCDRCWNHETCEVLSASRGKVQMANMHADITKGKKQKQQETGRDA